MDYSLYGEYRRPPFAWDIDRSPIWKHLDITTMQKRAATKCCGCYT